MYLSKWQMTIKAGLSYYISMSSSKIKWKEGIYSLHLKTSTFKTFIFLSGLQIKLNTYLKFRRKSSKQQQAKLQILITLQSPNIVIFH